MNDGSNIIPLSQRPAILDCRDIGGVDRVANIVSQHIEAGDVILLDGPLAAGKTAFAQLLCSHLGVEDHVTSPTYVVANVYRSRKFSIVHADAYRLRDANDFYLLGLDEEIDGALLIVEWGSRVLPLFPCHLKVDIEFSSLEGARKLTVSSVGTTKFSSLITSLRKPSK